MAASIPQRGLDEPSGTTARRVSWSFMVCVLAAMGASSNTYEEEADLLDLIERGALKKDPGGGRSTSYSLADQQNHS